jgi:hypothetical protein
MRGTDLCYRHGPVIHRKRRLARGILPKQANMIATGLRLLFHNQALPLELMQTELFRSAWANFNPRTKRTSAPLLKEIVLAWYRQQDGDPSAWSAAVTKARQLGYL